MVKKIFCDFCGEEIQESEWVKVLTQNVKTNNVRINYDVCANCAKIAETCIQRIQENKGDYHPI